MQDINSKVNNGGATADGQASADEWNQFVLELQNVIESTGQTLNGGILTQIGQGIAAHGTNGDFTTDSGVPDAYVLSTVGGKDAAPDYADGMRLRFIAGNTNTLATATINYAGKGVKNLVNLSAGDLSTTDENIIVFRSGSDDFVLKAVAGSGGIVVGHDKIERSDRITTTSVIPYDTTQPQISEGALVLTLPAYTPDNASNRLVVRSGIFLSALSTSVAHLITAVFQDATLNAIVAGSHRAGNLSDEESTMILEKEFVAGSTTPTVFTSRFGPNLAFAAAINGDGGQKLGTSSICWLSVTEYLP